MFSESLGKKVVKLIIWLNWFNVGVGILWNLILFLEVLDCLFWLEHESSLLRDFLILNRSFLNRNGFYVIAFVTGLILIGIWLNVLLTNAVEKCDEQNFLMWLKRTGLWAIVEWSLIGYMSLPSVHGIRFIIIFDRICTIGWIYITLRIIYPLISSFIIFRIYFEVQLYFRSDEYKRIQSSTEV